MSLHFLLSFISLLTTLNCQTYTGSANVLGSNIVTINIDYDANLVVLVLNGPSNVWYGFGFGNTIMDGTYAIIMEYNRNDLSQGLVWEFTLGSHRKGSIYKSREITVLSDINDGQTRSVSIIRSIDGIYTFPSPPIFPSIPFIINIITAIGSIPADFQTARNAVHLSTNSASTSIIMSPVTTETPTYTPIQTTNNNYGTLHSLQCTSNNCMGQNIDCVSNNNNEACIVECLSEKACYNSTIVCNSDANCLIEGANVNALTNANIIAPIDYNLNILCNDIFSCQNTKIYATYSSVVHMHCAGVKSCQNFEIFCPPHSESKNCVIRGNIVDGSVDGFSEQTSMIIHAANGWNDIDLSQYSPRMELSGNNIMYCELGSCNITHVDGTWNCYETYSNCYDTTTTNQPLMTPIPTTSTTTSTTTNTATNCYMSIGSVHTGNLDVTSTINCMYNTITFDITYKGYNSNWFGLVFNTEMFGDAIIFTTGKNNDRKASLYSYNISGKTLSDVVYQVNKIWIQISVILDIFSSNGLRIVYEMNLDETIWNKYTNVIQFNEAIGSSLMLEKHTTSSTNTFDINFIAQTTTTSPTTQAPTLSPSTTYPTKNPTIICAPNSDNLSSKINTGNDNNELIVLAILNCMDNRITFDITYHNYNENWFGLIFSNQMNGKAIIYTSGLSGNEFPRLYSYDIVGHTPSDILYNQNENWIQILTEIDGNSIHIVYQQELSKTDWHQNTKQIIFRYAIGNQLLLQYHKFRSDQVFTLNLNAILSTTIIPTNPPTTLAPIPTIANKPEITSLESVECLFGDILNGVSYTEKLMVNVTLNCIENTIILDITYKDYNHNWFGLVFNNEMYGNSVIFTTGFYNDHRASLYSYNIYGKYTEDVQYDSDKNWIEIETIFNANTNNGIQIKYKQELDKTQWNKNTNEIQFRYAIGSSLFLAYHSFKSQQTYNIYLNELIQQKEDNVTVVCNEDSMCLGTVIKCTDANICIINCISAQSCMNTLFECTNGYDCYLNCIGYESCKQSTIQCADYSNCFIYGLGEKSLYEMQINGQLHTQLLANNYNVLKIECSGEFACYKSLIAAGFCDKLDIICSAKQSCNFIKIQCPPFTHEANCKILATIEEESVGEQIDIFAINSWMDIDNTSYVPLTTTLGMFCGTMYSNRCLMQINNENKNEWNCESKISKCYVDIYQYNLPVLIIRCDMDQPCYNKIVSCDNDEYKICRIICNGFGSCSGSDIICSATNNNTDTVEKCEIICNGDNSCSDISSIQCGTSGECDIECYGNKSCTNISIECGPNGNCHINGMDAQSLIASHIKCLENSNCDINCNEYGTCNEVVIYGKESNSIDILCVDNSCNNIELYCPPSADRKQCIISGQGDIHDQLIIYCPNSWNDIDLTNYFCVLDNHNMYNDNESDHEAIVSSKMYCGDSLTDFCIIQMNNGLNGNDWNCMDEHSICYLPPVPPQSSISTTINDSDEEMTDIPTNMEWTQSELIAIIVICCLVLGIMCLLGIYCWWYKPNKIKNKYKNVNNTKKKKKKKNKKNKRHNKENHDYDDDDSIQLDYAKNNAIVEIDARTK